jgi:hypothetical protein
MYNGIMTGAGATNFEFHNLAPEEGFCGIQMTELNEFCPESGSRWNSESSGIQLGHSGLAEHSLWTGPLDRTPSLVRSGEPT